MSLRLVCGFLDKNNKFWNSRDEYDAYHLRVRLMVATVQSLTSQGNHNLCILNEQAIKILSNETLRAICNDLKVHV